MRPFMLALALVLVGAFTPAPETATGATSDAGGDQRVVTAAAVPFVVDLSLSGRGHFRRDGSAVVSATVTCSRKADFAYMEVMLRQRAGRRYVFGWGSLELSRCRRGTNEARIVVEEADGVFRGGAARLQAFVVACRPKRCAEDVATRSIRLRGKKR